MHRSTKSVHADIQRLAICNWLRDTYSSGLYPDNASAWPDARSAAYNANYIRDRVMQLVWMGSVCTTQGANTTTLHGESALLHW
jgi:hypothetical protein